MFVVAISLGYWFHRGQHYYTGPRTRARVVRGKIVRDESTESIGDREKAAAAGLNLRAP